MSPKSGASSRRCALRTGARKSSSRRCPTSCVTWLAPLRNALALLLRREGRVSRETVSIYKMMERQVHQLVRLMDDLLDVSRINHGKLELQHQRLELASLVRDAIETCEHAMREADLPPRCDASRPTVCACMAIRYA